jgi:coenzyme F420 hydrogenase subunit beta
MSNKNPIMGQKALKERVLDKSLCTNCGACINLCPYTAIYKDQTVLLDACNREEGRCYAFCPRTPTDLQALQEQLFAAQDITPEVGALKGFHMTRAADPQVRKAAQHGGTVTALIKLALEEGIIDTAIVAEEGGDFLPSGKAVKDLAEIPRRGKSKFVVSPTLAAFNQAAQGEAEKIGVVATPCQALALARMRSNPLPGKDSNIGKLRLVVGLFCGWAFSWRELTRLLKEKLGGAPILGLDIPPSKYHSMEVHTSKGVLEIPLDEVFPSVRPACQYCFDMTGEFTDLSVGSARCPEGWEIARGWNQVIVRTPMGVRLMERARIRGVLEFREMPAGNLERLKKAALNKKRTAVKNLAEKSGDAGDLIYLSPRDPVFRKAMKSES